LFFINGDRRFRNMKLDILRTDKSNGDFRKLTALLDAELSQRYGALQKHYDKHNRTDTLQVVIMLYLDGAAAACGALREFDSGIVEIKRMFVAPEFRRKGLARRMLGELEAIAGEQGYHWAVLETGIKQVEAIGLYQSIGYEKTENYGAYAGNENSVCMKKTLVR
jgi:putative acetyltransferase